MVNTKSRNMDYLYAWKIILLENQKKKGSIATSQFQYLECDSITINNATFRNINGRLLLENEKIGATCSTLNEFQCLGCNNTYINTWYRITLWIIYRVEDFFIGKRGKNRRNIPALNQSRYKIIYLDWCATVNRSETVAEIKHRAE